MSLKLLNHLELKKSLVSYHEHNKAESGEKILARLLAGETCALVTDAGSPRSPTRARISCGCARSTA